MTRFVIYTCCVARALVRCVAMTRIYTRSQTQVLKVRASLNRESKYFKQAAEEAAAEAAAKKAQKEANAAAVAREAAAKKAAEEEEAEAAALKAAEEADKAESSNDEWDEYFRCIGAERGRKQNR